MTATVLIMAGGTGGHVFPALAVAEQLARRGFGTHWLGAGQALEGRVVPQAGIPLETVPVSGLRGRGRMTWMLASPQLSAAVFRVWRLIRRLRPRCVLGMGGYASGPGGLAAWLCRCPLLLHEQNAVPSLTNRLLAPLAVRCLEGFPTMASGDRIYTGNPVRASFCGRPSPVERWSHRSSRAGGSRPRLLVLGGSQGAAALNAALPSALALMPPAARPQVLHQCGAKDERELRQAYDSQRLEVEVRPFIDDMAAAYQWADLALCRAGALTLAELAAIGLGALLVPLVRSAGDHQALNARFFADAGAAQCLPEPELRSAELLSQRLCTLLRDDDALLAMAEAAHRMAVPDAASRVAEQCEAVIHG